MKLKKRLFIVKSLTLAMVLILAVMLAAPALAWPDTVNQAQIDASIDKGLEWLAEEQNPDGSWSTSYKVGQTGLAVLKFETHAVFMGMSPFDPSYKYSDNVAAGLKYIFSMTSNVTSSNTTYNRDPDTNGNGILVRAYQNYPMYETGIALMAICASNEPDRIISGSGKQDGRKFKDVAQDMVDFIAWGQNEYGDVTSTDPDRGGWRYQPNYGTSDNSITGYVTIGLAYAEASPPWGFGLTIPSWVFSELQLFIGAVQDPQSAADPSGYDGGSWYEPQARMWINMLKTGNLLNEMALVGYGPGHDNVTQAREYMERHWLDPNYSGPEGAAYQGWYGQNQGQPSTQTCFTMMKGFQALGIDTIDYGSGPASWYGEMATRIVNTQNPDGSWPTDYWGTNILSTAWAMLALEKAAPPAMALIPPFDINLPGTDHTVTAIYKIAGVPQEDVEIEFEVLSGPNAGDAGSDNTSATGEATFTYTGDGGPGTDIIKATAVLSGLSSQATKVWEAPTPVEVGGEVYPVDKLSLLAPWIALSALLIPAIIVMRRRRARS